MFVPCSLPRLVMCAQLVTPLLRNSEKYIIIYNNLSRFITSKKNKSRTQPIYQMSPRSRSKEESKRRGDTTSITSRFIQYSNSVACLRSKINK